MRHDLHPRSPTETEKTETARPWRNDATEGGMTKRLPLFARLYARHSPLDHIAESGRAILAACEALAADPSTSKADALMHQLSATETATRRLRVELASGIHGHGTG